MERFASGRNMIRRGMFVVVGILIIGFSVGLMKLAALGVDPFTSMNSGVCEFVGIQYGTWQLSVNLALLMMELIFTRKYVGFGTIINMVFVGYTADFTLWVLGLFGIESISSVTVRVLLMMAGVVLIAMAMGMYMAADMGLSPYDALGTIIADRLNGKLQYRVVRIITDAAVVAVAFAAGIRMGITWEIIGAGTIAMVALTGPMCQYSRTRWFDRMVEAEPRRRRRPLAGRFAV